MTDILVSFVRLYGYEYLGVYPSYLTTELTIKQEMENYPPILSADTQGKFLSIMDGFYHVVLERAQNQWEKLTAKLVEEAHVKAMRGTTPDELVNDIEVGRTKMNGYRQA